MSEILISPHTLPDFPLNIATMLRDNCARFGEKSVYQEDKGKGYESITWEAFYKAIENISANLKQFGFKRGDKVAIFSKNRLEMLEMELSVMASGGVSVPIFAGYPKETASRLIEFSDAAFLVISDQSQLDRVNKKLQLKGIFHFENVESSGSIPLIPFAELFQSVSRDEDTLGFDVAPNTVTLMMFTSGTMGMPKCVMLTHQNILSQQAAMKVLWNIFSDDRFLSYLPWHHSFGGIFELFAAITNGALFSLEHGFGKDTDILLSNWEQVKPTIFFSVPKVYQEITSRAMENPDVEHLIFHTGLRFVFTAAAPLPTSISEIFESRGIPVIEGWGLTETSPCCTVTDPAKKRIPGIVGLPIPGIQIKLSEDNEIVISGPNVMKGYYKNEEATKTVLNDDGWFYTGDVGEFVPNGLRLISRKDRILKLSNAEKVYPAEIENLISNSCFYLSHVYVVGSGKEFLAALLFRNHALFEKIPKQKHLMEGCKRPKSVEHLVRCLEHCLKELNRTIDVPYYKPGAVILMNQELSIDRGELTPSMKLAPKVVAQAFKAEIECLYGSSKTTKEDVYVIRLRE